MIVGAAKAGTTAIAKHIGNHPESFVPEVKEPRYFVRDILQNISKSDPLYDYLMDSSVFDWSDYLDLFSEAKESEIRLGEGSVHYLYHHETAIPQILERLGDIPIIIVLRDPVSRAYSNYNYLTHSDPSSFEKALAKEEERKQAGFNAFWFHKDLGNYYEQVKAYLDAFSNVHVCLYDDFQSDPKIFMRELFGFLGIDDSFELDYSKRYNETEVSNRLHYFIQKYGLKVDFLSDSMRKKLKKYLLFKKKSTISPKTKASLRDYFREDLKRLEKLIDKDLSKWHKI